MMALLKDAEFNRHWVYRSGGATILEDSGYPLGLRVRRCRCALSHERQGQRSCASITSRIPLTREIIVVITNFPRFVFRTRRELVRVARVWRILEAGRHNKAAGWR